MFTQNSFPSGHATTCFAIFTTFAFISRDNKLRALLAVLAILFALTRVYLSQHFLEDVLVGSLIGTLTAVFIGLYMFNNRFLEKLG
jgi:membrane-associated phospholipid phosphatase